MCNTMPYCGLCPQDLQNAHGRGNPVKGGLWVRSGGPEDVVFLVFIVHGAELALSQLHTGIHSWVSQKRQ